MGNSHLIYFLNSKATGLHLLRALFLPVQWHSFGKLQKPMPKYHEKLVSKEGGRKGFHSPLNPGDSAPRFWEAPICPVLWTPDWGSEPVHRGPRDSWSANLLDGLVLRRTNTEEKSYEIALKHFWWNESRTAMRACKIQREIFQIFQHIRGIPTSAGPFPPACGHGHRQDGWEVTHSAWRVPPSGAAFVLDAVPTVFIRWHSCNAFCFLSAAACC